MAIKDGNTRVNVTLTAEELAAMERLRGDLGVSSVGKALASLARDHMSRSSDAVDTLPLDANLASRLDDTAQALGLSREQAVVLGLSALRLYGIDNALRAASDAYGTDADEYWLTLVSASGDLDVRNAVFSGVLNAAAGTAGR